MSDGKITFKTKIDNSDIEKDLNEAKKKIRKAEEDIAKVENAKLPLTKQMESLDTALKGAKSRMDELKQEQQAIAMAMAPGSSIEDYIAAKSDKGRIDAAAKEQEKKVSQLQKQWDSVNEKVGSYDAKIKEANASLAANKEKAGELSSKLSKGGVDISGAMEKAGKTATMVKRRFSEIIRQAFFFSLISKGVQSIVTYMGKVLKTNDQFVAQLAQMKGALLNAFQPIFQAILPGLIAILRVLTAIVQTVANIFAHLFGTTAKGASDAAEILHNEAAAIEGVGAAAKKAQKQLAAFDEINKLEGPDIGGGGGSGGGGAVTGDIMPNFDNEWLNMSAEKLKEIEQLIITIGAGLLAWKISSMFTDSLATAAGLGIAVGGAFLYAFGWADAFTNGIDWKNLSKMLIGMAAIAGGLALAFGAVGGAVGFLIGGVGLLVASLIDFMHTGELTDQALAALEAGIAAISIAISILTGNWIPLVIGYVIGMVALFAQKGEEIIKTLRKVDDFLKNVFARDWGEIFPILGDLVMPLIKMIQGFASGGIQSLTGLINFIQGVFSGNWRRAWSGVKEIFRGVFNQLLAIAKVPLNGIISIINSAISGINVVLRTANRLPGVNISKVPKIPYLAKGVVLPPNKPFMAMVGDQRHGTNIEAPLSTIQEAVAAVMQDQTSAILAGFEASVGVQREILEAVLGIQIGDDVIGNAMTRYTRKQAVIAGGLYEMF